MPNMKGNVPHISLVAIVRDKNGKPKFNDLNNIPSRVWDALTNKEQQEIENDRSTSSRIST